MALGLLVAVLAGFIGIAGPAQVLNLSWGLWFGEVFVFLGIPFVALRLVGREGDARQLSRGFTWQFALFGFVIGAINYVAWAVPLMSLAQAIFPKSMVELFDGSAIFKNQRPLEVAAIVAGVSIAAPIAEEFFFRGVIQRGLFTWLGPRGAILLTAVISHRAPRPADICGSA